MPLREEHGWLPDLEAVPPEVAEKATVMWLNYPNNPTAATAGLDFFDRVVAFARRHDIAVLHDACYSEVAYDGYRPASFLQAEGAMDVGMEFHSLSKSYNMTGWRLGMAVGNPQMIANLMVVKSNLDSGVPQAIQQMGVEALGMPLDAMEERNATYQRRRDLIVEALRGMGLRVTPPRASLYVWASVPEGYTSAEFSERLLEERDVLVSPGTGYGKYGEGYVRLSMTVSDSDLDRALDRLTGWSIPPPQARRKTPG
jgi:LL-diaminopimelate aminotransferase